MKKKLTKEQWIQAAYLHLCKRTGSPSEPITANECKNLREWAQTIADCGYLKDGYGPEEAVEEDLSYA